MKKVYDYYSDWGPYAFPEEESRFLTDEELLENCCDCIHLKDRNRKKTSGGIPVLYKDDKLYVLKEGHAKVEAESGNMKSRAVARGSIISAAYNGDSVIVTDPKGELSNDPKIMGFLKSLGVKTYILDFRNFNKDGFNVLAYPFELMENGDENEAANSISKFVNSLLEDKKTNDDFWNDSAKILFENLSNIILKALAQKNDGGKAANLITLMRFISKDKEFLKDTMDKIRKSMPANTLYNPAAALLDVFANPEKTYACIMTATMAMLKDFKSSPALTKMLSVSTFDIRKFYEEPSSLFIVVPDETSAYDKIVGYLMDTMYQLLVAIYTKKYQNRRSPYCRIHFIADEFANIVINDMGAKISASRSREIEWTLIYQSEKQLRASYADDYDTIRGNCRNTLFLGSSDYSILSAISEQCGYTKITADGRSEALVKVEDLRKMRKEKEYKEALLIRGNHLYTAKLPDYEQYPFLNPFADMVIVYETNIAKKEAIVYLPEKLRDDVTLGRVSFV